MSLTVATRLFDLSPATYDEANRTVDAVLSKGSPVACVYGTEVLRIAPSAVDYSRVDGVGIPVLDSHLQVGIGNMLGRVTNVWIENGTLLGRLLFNATEEGRKAEGMVARKELNGVSIGYRVNDWVITDSDGRVIDPAVERMRWDDDNLTFTASRWKLLELSLVSVPADSAAEIRSYDRELPPSVAIIADVRARMLVRHRMHERQQEMLARCDVRGRMTARQGMHDRHQAMLRFRGRRLLASSIFEMPA
jgi:phage head maturation protease